MIICDCEGVTSSHVAMMTPTTMKRHIYVFQDCYPMKDQNLIDKSSMVFINMPRIVETVFNLFLSLSNEMYKKMIKVHKKGEKYKLTGDLGSEIVPPEYQGNGITIKVFFSRESDSTITNVCSLVSSSIRLQNPSTA